jgi:hypothetical protein
LGNDDLRIVESAVTVFQAAKDLGVAFQQWKNKPKLVFEKIYVANFSVPKAKEFKVARFVIATVRNVGGVAARECLGIASSEARDLKEYKLHWSDTEYKPLRDTAETVDIPPQTTRDLDVAFSVGGAKSVGSFGANRQVGYVVARMSGSVPAIGTTVVNLVSEYPPTVGTVPSVRVNASAPEPSIFEQEESLTGAWIAVPLALCFPQEGSEFRLRPSFWSDFGLSSCGTGACMPRPWWSFRPWSAT